MCLNPRELTNPASTVLAIHSGDAESAIVFIVVKKGKRWAVWAVDSPCGRSPVPIAAYLKRRGGCSSVHGSKWGTCEDPARPNDELKLRNVSMPSILSACFCSCYSC